MNNLIRIVQHNVNGQRVASQQLREYCKEQKVSLTLVQEPVYCDGRVYGFEDCRTIADKSSPGAVVLVMDNDLPTIALTVSLSTYIAVSRLAEEQARLR